jgi:hypothetical protein
MSDMNEAIHFFSVPAGLCLIHHRQLIYSFLRLSPTAHALRHANPKCLALSVKKRSPTDNANKGPILGGMRCMTQICVASLLKPKSLTSIHQVAAQTMGAAGKAWPPSAGRGCMRAARGGMEIDWEGLDARRPAPAAPCWTDHQLLLLCTHIAKRPVQLSL